jgi:hypothetical protein
MSLRESRRVGRRPVGPRSQRRPPRGPGRCPAVCARVRADPSGRPPGAPSVCRSGDGVRTCGADGAGPARPRPHRCRPSSRRPAHAESRRRTLPGTPRTPLMDLHEIPHRKRATGLAITPIFQASCAGDVRRRRPRRVYDTRPSVTLASLRLHIPLAQRSPAGLREPGGLRAESGGSTRARARATASARARSCRPGSGEVVSRCVLRSG